MDKLSQRKWLTGPEVRQVYGIGPGLLRRLAEEKKVVLRRPGGKRKLYQVRSLEMLLR
ncbi:MAG: hypothetical protein GX937_02835 [Lentisphaerae bacterium]|jgi:hypothetical protein|nr:hypothetical protein [Lentisphaerota bacterium]